MPPSDSEEESSEEDSDSEEEEQPARRARPAVPDGPPRRCVLVDKMLPYCIFLSHGDANLRLTTSP